MISENGFISSDVKFFSLCFGDKRMFAGLKDSSLYGTGSYPFLLLY